MFPNEEKIVTLLHDLGKRTPVPSGDPESAAWALHRLRLGVARRRRTWELQTVVLAVAAVVCLLTAPLYYGIFSGRPRHEPAHVAARNAAAGEIPAALLARILQLEAAVRQQETLFTAMPQGVDGRDNFVTSALAVSHHRSRIAARLPSLLARPADDRLEFSEAVLCYAARLLAKAQAIGPVLVVNGQDAPGRAGERSRRDKDAYYLAQDAAYRLSELLPELEEIGLDDRLRRAIIEHAAHPDHPLPQDLVDELSASIRTPPLFMVVTVRLSEGAFREGQLSLALFDSHGKARPESAEIPFSWSSVPLPLFDCFKQRSQELGKVDVSSGAAEEVIVTFKGEGGDARVFFSAIEGLPVAKNFPGRLVELCFEARAEVGPGQRLPRIQFGSGGDQVFATSMPSRELGPRWRRFSLPIDLGDASLWANGLFVQALSLGTGERVSVNIRNACIRSLDKPQSGVQLPGVL